MAAQGIYRKLCQIVDRDMVLSGNVWHSEVSRT